MLQTNQAVHQSRPRLVNGILGVLDIVLDGNVLILGDVVVGHFDDRVVFQWYKERDMRRLQQRIVFARVIDELQRLS